MGTETEERVQYKKEWYKKQKLRYPEKFKAKNADQLVKPEVVSKIADNYTHHLDLNRDSDEDLKILGELHENTVKYTPEDKIAAATAFIVTGEYQKASRLCGIHPDAIRYWRNTAGWWGELVAILKKQKQDEIDGAITGVLHNAVGVIADKLENGEEVVGKNGVVVHKMPALRDVVMALGILFDKRQLLRGDPTSRSVNNSTTDTLKKIQSQFEDMARQMGK